MLQNINESILEKMQTEILIVVTIKGAKTVIVWPWHQGLEHLFPHPEGTY